MLQDLMLRKQGKLDLLIDTAVLYSSSVWSPGAICIIIRCNSGRMSEVVLKVAMACKVRARGNAIVTTPKLTEWTRCGRCDAYLRMGHVL